MSEKIMKIRAQLKNAEAQREHAKKMFEIEDQNFQNTKINCGNELCQRGFDRVFIIELEGTKGKVIFFSEQEKNNFIRQLEKNYGPLDDIGVSCRDESSFWGPKNPNEITSQILSSYLKMLEMGYDVDFRSNLLITAIDKMTGRK